MSLEMCIVPASLVSTERNANLLTVIKQLPDPVMFVESVEPSCCLTKFFLSYKRIKRRQKQTKHAFSLLKKDELGTQQTIVS